MCIIYTRNGYIGNILGRSFHGDSWRWNRPRRLCIVCNSLRPKHGNPTGSKAVARFSILAILAFLYSLFFTRNDVRSSQGRYFGAADLLLNNRGFVYLKFGTRFLHVERPYWCRVKLHGSKCVPGHRRSFQPSYKRKVSNGRGKRSFPTWSTASYNSR